MLCCLLRWWGNRWKGREDGGRVWCCFEFFSVAGIRAPLERKRGGHCINAAAVTAGEEDNEEVLEVMKVQLPPLIGAVALNTIQIQLK